MTTYCTENPTPPGAGQLVEHKLHTITHRATVDYRYHVFVCTCGHWAVTHNEHQNHISEHETP